jgi:exonuclease VII small subunit
LKATGTVLAVVASLATVVWGQSLEELAQKEKARRKATATAKTFTNDDLAKPSPSPSPTAEPQGTPGKPERPARRTYQPSAPVPSGGTAEGGGVERQVRRPEGSEPAADEAGSEGYWRGRAQALRETVDKMQQGIAALEARISQLQLDRDPNPPDQFDPNRLQKRDAERLKSIEELERARTSLAGAQQAVRDLADEARRKGVPASWVQ